MRVDLSYFSLPQVIRLRIAYERLIELIFCYYILPTLTRQESVAWPSLWLLEFRKESGEGILILCEQAHILIKFRLEVRAVGGVVSVRA